MLNVIRHQQHNLLRRTSVSVSASHVIEEQNVDFQEDFVNAQPYKNVPKVSAFKILSAFMDKKQKTIIDKVMKAHHEKLGPIFKFSILGQPDRVLIENPEMMKRVLNKDGKYPHEPGFDPLIYYRNNIRKDLFYETAGLVGSSGEEWARVRSLVQQSMMRPKSAMFYIKDIEDISREMVNFLESKRDGNDEVDDLTADLYKWSLESIAAIFLNTRLGCLGQNLSEESDSKQFINAVNTFLGPDLNDIVIGPPIWKYYSTSTFKKWDKAQVKMYNITKKYIDKAVETYREDEPEDKMSVLHKMIRKCGTDSQIPLVMAQDALIAGVDTTGTTAAFLLLELAQHPDHQDILYKEITEIIQDGPITESMINKMKYLKACFQESIRLNPAIIGYSRTTHVDMVLEGYQIPKGTVVSYFIMNVMKDAKHFKEPEQFIPERWMRGCPQQHGAHPFATIPFAHGPRKCIGKRFAELECYILVIKMLQKFKLEYHHEPVGIQTDFVQKPDKKIKMKLISRN